MNKVFLHFKLTSILDESGTECQQYVLCCDIMLNSQVTGEPQNPYILKGNNGNFVSVIDGNKVKWLKKKNDKAWTK